MKKQNQPEDALALSERANKLNPRKISEEQARNLEASLEQFGDLSGIIYNIRTGNLVGGHQRISIFKNHDNPKIVRAIEVRDAVGTVSMGYFETNGTRYIYREVDWPREKEIAAMVAANKQGGEWDIGLLADLMKEAPNMEFPLGLFGFSDAELTNLLDAVKLKEEPEKEDVGDLIDKAAKLQKKWKTAVGQVWQVERHLIRCGDSLKLPVPATALVGLVDMVWTDPPWNVGLGKKPNPKRLARQIQNDDLGTDFSKFMRDTAEHLACVVRPGGPIYVAMSPQEWSATDQSLQAAGFHWSSTIIWAKDALILVRKDYQTQYEPIWYGWRDTAPRIVKVKDRKQSDLWAIPRPKRSEEHPTMKPVELVKRAILNSSLRGAWVYDPFLGSGTTAVASQETGRCCFGTELDPKYVAVTLERLANLGLKPKLSKSE